MENQKSLKEQIKEVAEYEFNSFVDDKMANGEVSTHSNYVPYGSTYVNQGDYISDSDMERLKDEFIEWLKENNNGVAKEYLEDNDIQPTDENAELMIKISDEEL